jgi:aquaporin Z
MSSDDSLVAGLLLHENARSGSMTHGVLHERPREPSREVRAAAALTLHWPEYLIEAACLGLFMVSACLFGTLFEHPASPVRQAIDDPLVRRIPMGLAMGLTAILLIYSPFGMRSGAHMNPSTTLTFFRLGKVRGADAVGYVTAQLVGGIAGVQIASTLLGTLAANPAVNYVATLPGMLGLGVAWLAELVISFLMMLVVLTVSNGRFARFTGLCAGALVMTFVVVEAPLSGMSLNPARSLGSAVAAHAWSDLWIYFTAPPFGMLLASELYLRVRGLGAVLCAKLAHPSTGPCLFRCAYRRDRPF